MRKLAGTAGAFWGVGGVLALLIYSTVRLSGDALAAVPLDWHAGHWVVLLVFTGFMAHAEGYKGFQTAFSPRVVARAQHIREAPTLLNVLLAPLFCMAYFGATRRRMIATYALTAMIVSFVLLFQYIPQPWRGILDVGVVVGLIWGIVSLGAYAVRALAGHGPGVSPELPQAV